MESLAIFVGVLLVIITLAAPFAFLLTTEKIQDFTVTRGALHRLRQVVAYLLASGGIFLAAITGLNVSGSGVRIFFLGIIALNVFAIIREIKYAQKRRIK
jgi:hypothetical protein